VGPAIARNPIGFVGRTEMLDMKFEDIEQAERLVRRRKQTIRSAIAIMSCETVQVSMTNGRGRLDVPTARILEPLVEAAKAAIAEIDHDLVALGVEKPAPPPFAISDAGELIIPEESALDNVHLLKPYAARS
jgi:hypothetical protein